jgi:hypothetical protein
MDTERLINSTEELQAVMGAVNTDLVFEAIQSFVDDAETNHIIPAIGRGLYDALREDSLTAKHEIVLKMLRKSIANFTVHYYVAFGSVQITESGILVKRDANSLPASDKKVYQLRTQSRADAYKALESAIIYLESNQADFTEYTSDAAHANNRALYVNTTAEFSAGYELRDNAETFYRLRGTIKTVEENYIDNILGDTLSEALREAILDNSTTTAQKKLIAKIVKASALLTIAEAIPYNLVAFDASGLVTPTIKSNSDNVEASTEGDMRRLQGIMNVTRANGLSEHAKLIKFLNANAADYTGYVAQDIDARSTVNDADRGIYLL